MKEFSRRKFIGKVGHGTLAALATSALPIYASGFSKDASKPAVLGGTAIRHNKTWPRWPFVDEKMVESIVKTTKSGIWSRIQSKTGTVPTFEKRFAELIGSAYCVGTGSGTQALSTCIEALNIGPGDEVITSPYTDFGTISAILTSRALPVLVDLDPESFQLDPDEVERSVNANTKAIMPVHIMGLPANMERIMGIARKHRLKVIEDACQAPFSKYQGQAVGLIGDLGCFSFQASKSIAAGEGGAIVGNDERLMDECYTVQNRGTSKAGANERIGPKYRMNEFEGAILMGQLDKVKERFETRNSNAEYLNEKLKDFQGVIPQKQYPGTESGAYYNYAMRYDKAFFDGLERSQFLKAIQAEGVPFTSYIRKGLHKDSWVDTILAQRVYQQFFSDQRLKDYREALYLPKCDEITDETLIAFWASGVLLGSRSDMDDIVNAIIKVYENRASLKKV
ncbi:DegT/DnrJ/EryC1/StrS family aminotransferase [Parapedobacter sp. 10938]|uniref:DegT/DnrJ/EryC1/StrS family aminotransferase n=1 Tax=Parapedobacter flavus TaxID=3110225 RepID=UPI002DBC50DB|nr:DegT/DnrJ/EryC1/StrS family aminotransferase [Parapedobacter sp. 10938]MEC3878308.1 DegT/DnrJ/EryC1/StrS family aminotransferase [Parapedobacter sp. 10938]